MKIIHFSDFHFDATTADRALASLAVVAETGEREKVSAFVLAGDLFNRGIQNSAAGRLPHLPPLGGGETHGGRLPDALHP